ncbi:14554_t:CDS:2 [Ambispora leptoticha]|uniref:protein-tyrosine-phosphatase n=1 Tax=Ambispora leptoticha TaxID=144679 RepID=A0A9N8Z0Y5_9GLOM|nr:14554_t:CDS:2 [Ambispora leptoticha]
MSVTAATSIDVSSNNQSWAAADTLNSATTPASNYIKRDNCCNNAVSDSTVTAATPVEMIKKPVSAPSSKGRRNMKNLQLVVPPVRSSISAPNSPQIPLTSGAHSHNRRPSTPICVYQNKPSELCNNSQSAADPMALISRTENEIGEDSPYKEGPIRILPHLYLGTELNAANRPMLSGLNIEYILNVGKEVEVPYLDEIIGLGSKNDNKSNDDHEDQNNVTYADHNQISPGLSTSSSLSSDHSYQTAASSPVAPSPIAPSIHNDSPLFPASPFTLAPNNSIKKASLTSARSNSMSYTLAQRSLASGTPLTVPGTKEFKPIKYKKFFWTHNQENLITDFISAFAFIDEARSAGRNILVHCQCGVSRSASLIIAYVMKVNRMTLNQAYEFVKDRSSYISPNMSLVYQLVDFEKTLKLSVNNNNSGNNNSSTSAKNRSEQSIRHSRNSSIESDLLLNNHRRSSILQQSQHQSTVKGGSGRFHVITAPIASPNPPSPSPLSPPSSSLSPTSTLKTRASHSSLLSPPLHNLRPRSPSSPAERVSLSSQNSPLSPTFPFNSTSSDNNPSPSLPISFPDYDLTFPFFPFNVATSRKSSIIDNNKNNGNVIILGAQEQPGFFDSGSKMDTIFSPTRATSPVTTPSFNDLLWRDD